VDYRSSNHNYIPFNETTCGSLGISAEDWALERAIATAANDLNKTEKRYDKSFGAHSRNRIIWGASPWKVCDDKLGRGKGSGLVVNNVKE